VGATNPFPSLKEAPAVLGRVDPAAAWQQLRRFLRLSCGAVYRHWFIAFEAGRTDHAEELDTTATKLGRLAAKEP
jgi:hypothetical protein